MQGQANCPLDEPSRDISLVPDERQWHLLPGGNRTQLKGVTIRTVSVNTLRLQNGAELTLGRIESRLVNLLVYSTIYMYEIPFPKLLNLGSTDPMSHCGAILLGGEEENL